MLEREYRLFCPLDGIEIEQNDDGVLVCSSHGPFAFITEATHSGVLTMSIGFNHPISRITWFPPKDAN